MKQNTQNGMEHVNASVDQMQVFVMITNVGIKRNSDINMMN